MGNHQRLEGQFWENRFAWACKYHKITAFKIPMGAKMVSAHKMIRVQTPFDWIICKQGKAAFIDTKHTQGKAFTKSLITPHQLMALREAHDQGIIAGYIINFSEADQIVFFNGEQLHKCFNGERLIPESGLLLGTHDNFDLDKLFGS